MAKFKFGFWKAIRTASRIESAMLAFGRAKAEFETIIASNQYPMITSFYNSIDEIYQIFRGK